MPGHSDVWNHVTVNPFRRASARSQSPATPTASTEAPESVDAADTLDTAETAPRHGKAFRLGALGTALVLLAGGSAAVAGAHKSVTVDIDGEVVEASTFAGNVANLLEEEGVEVGERDLVAPGADTALREGDEVVVRHARQLTVLTDGEESRVWSTALSADEALAGLAGRGDDVSLVASRSLGTGRADLAVRLDLDGPVDVVVDGRTEHVADGSVGLERVLADLDVTIGDLDRVRVQHGAEGDRLTVVVQRVVAEERATVTEIPFETTTTKTDDLYTGQSEVAVEGVVGERTTVHRVITVDGVQESALELSDTVTRAPVTHVVHEGTKKRPAPKPAPAPARSSSASSSSSSGSGSGGGGGASVGGGVWAALAQCESGGNPSIVSASGKYHGLYQFSVSTWRAVGGSGLPSQASPEEQTKRAKALQARSGWGQWPACSSKLGLR